MACLIRLPHEILHNVFAQGDAIDLAALSRTCRTFNALIHKNRCLFKELYLKAFDSRPRDAESDEPVWEELLPRLVKLQKILTSSDTDTKTATKPGIYS